MMSFLKATRALRFRLSLIVAILVAALNAHSPAIAQPSLVKSVNWATGSDFQRQRDAPISVTWNQVPLREVLERISQQTSVAIFLDRRVDPNLRISMQATAVPMSRVLASLAKRLDLGLAEVGPVVYIGPRFTADRLATLAIKRNEEALRLPASQTAVWRQQVPWSWGRLSEPRILLTQLAEDHGLQIKNFQRIPHDLWPSVQLPPLTLAERLTLFLSGFQMSYGFDKNHNVLLTKFPSAVSIERKYPLRQESREELITQLKSAFPQADVEMSGDSLIVRSTIEDHNAIQQRIAGGGQNADATPNDVSPAPVDFEQQRYRLRILNKEFAAVFRQLTKQLNLEVQLADWAAVDLKQLISVEVEDATIDALMEAVLKPVNLVHERNNRTLSVRPSK